MPDWIYIPLNTSRRTAALAVAASVAMMAFGPGPVRASAWSVSSPFACSSGGEALTVTSRGVRVIVSAGQSRSGRSCSHAASGEGLLTVIGPHGAIRAQQPFREQPTSAPVALAGGRVALLTLAPSRDRRRRTPESGIAIGTLRLLVGQPQDLLASKPQVLGTDVEASADQLVANRQGDLAVAWNALAGSTVRQMLEVRASDGSRRVHMLASVPDDWGARDIAWGPRRDLLIAYSRPQRGADRWTVYVQELRRSGSLSRAVALGSGENSMQIAVALGARGRAVVLWGSQGQAEEAGPYDVKASVRTIDGAAFGTGQKLETGQDTEDDQAGGLVDAVIARDRATAVFTAVRPGSEPAFIAQAGPSGRFAARRQILGGSGVVLATLPLRDSRLGVLEAVGSRLRLQTIDAAGRLAGAPTLIAQRGRSVDSGDLERDPTTGSLVAAFGYAVKHGSGQNATYTETIALAARR